MYGETIDMRMSWYCPKCGIHPGVITKLQTHPIIETYRWNGEYYEKILSNSGKDDEVICCSECSTRLVRR